MGVVKCELIIKNDTRYNEDGLNISINYINIYKTNICGNKIAYISRMPKKLVSLLHDAIPSPNSRNHGKLCREASRLRIFTTRPWSQTAPPIELYSQGTLPRVQTRVTVITSARPLILLIGIS